MSDSKPAISGSIKDSFRFLRPYLWRYRVSLGLGFGALIVKDVLGTAQPLVVRAAIDALTAGSVLGRIFFYCLVLAVVSAIKGLFQYWMRVLLIGISRDVEYDLRNELFAKLVTLDGGFYSRTRTGDIMARATNDMDAVRMMLGPGVMYTFETSLMLVMAIAVMLWADWRLTLVALSTAPLVTTAVLLFGRRIHDRFEKIQAMFSDISSRVQESLSGTRVIRAYVQESAEQARFEQLNREYINENLRLARISSVLNPLLQALGGVSFLLVLWVGGLRLAEHKISLGTFVMFNTYMGMQLLWPLIALGWVANLNERGRASLTRIRTMLAEFPEIAAPARPCPLPTPLRGDLEFRGVSVHFGDRAALRGINLKIEAGSTVAIVGHTGSGKSTLAHLIPRVMDPDAGSVRLDGIDLREFSPEDVRRHIGFVPQETFLFSATLGENIAFGVKGATGKEIERAAEIAGLAADISGFPEGYQTIVGERGITLSGGQKQRTAIARAVLRDPRILILDDALASVDTGTEERILAELSALMRGRTAVLISHRVSTVRHADKIFVLEHGELVASGSHAELIQQGGYYADLYQKQLLTEELEAI